MKTILSVNSLIIQSNDEGLGLHMQYQYGVQYPDGKRDWAPGLNSSVIQVEGHYVESGPRTSSTSLSFEEGNELWKGALKKRGVPGAEDMNLVRIRRPIQVIVNPAEVWHA